MTIAGINKSGTVRYCHGGSVQGIGDVRNCLLQGRSKGRKQ